MHYGCIVSAPIKQLHIPIITRAYVNRRGPRRKGVNMAVILSSLSLMAASLFGDTPIMQEVLGSIHSFTEDYCSWHRASRSLWEASLCEQRGLPLRC